MFYFTNTNINSDDVVFETENELNESLAQKRSMIFEILQAGLLQDENGKISNSMRYKILEQLGFGVWENSKDVKSLQIRQANKENLNLIENNKIFDPKEIDEHDLHINEHISFMLSDEYNKIYTQNNSIEQKMLNHIRLHKKFKLLTNNLENNTEN
jgi:hypothetical protein